MDNLESEAEAMRRFGLGMTYTALVLLILTSVWLLATTDENIASRDLYGAPLLFGIAATGLTGSLIVLFSRKD
jgi:hypothetical protein